LKSRLEQLERENKLLKKSLFDFTMRVDFNRQRVPAQQAQQQAPVPLHQQQPPHQQQQQQQNNQSQTTQTSSEAATTEQFLVLDSVLSSMSTSHNNSSLALDELDVRELMAATSLVQAASQTLDPDGEFDGERVSGSGVIVGSVSAPASSNTIGGAALSASTNSVASGGGGGGGGGGGSGGGGGGERGERGGSTSDSSQADGGAQAWFDGGRSRSSIRQVKLSHHSLQFHCGATLSKHAGAVHCAVFAPDGRALASGGFDKAVRIWRPDEHSGADAAVPLAWAATELRGHVLAISDVRWAQHCGEVSSSAFDATVRRWAVRGDGSSECATVHTVGARGIVQTLAYCRAEPTLVYGGSTSGALLAFDSRASEASVLVEGNSMINAVADVDGTIVATGDAMGRLRFWDRRAAAQPLADGRAGAGQPISCVAASDALDSDNQLRLLAASSFDNTLRVYRATATGVRRPLVSVTGVAVRNWPIRCAFYIGESFNLSDSVRGLRGALLLASGGADNVVSIAELADTVRSELHATEVLEAADTRAPTVVAAQQRLAGHTDRVYSIDVHPRAPMLASASADGTVRLWTPKNVSLTLRGEKSITTTTTTTTTTTQTTQTSQAAQTSPVVSSTSSPKLGPPAPVM
jgi:WD40 repeat protein